MWEIISVLTHRAISMSYHIPSYDERRKQIKTQADLVAQLNQAHQLEQAIKTRLRNETRHVQPAPESVLRALSPKTAQQLRRAREVVRQLQSNFYKITAECKINEHKD